jgi:hypothetical protein
MKMRKEHVAHIKAAVAKFDTDFHRSRYAAAGHSDKRYRWDLFRHAGLIGWCCDELYSYLNDEHIDTALRSIVKPLKRNAVGAACS